MGCFYSKTNNLGLGYLGITRDILGISQNVQPGSFLSAPGLLKFLTAPFGPRGMATLSPVL